MKIRLFCCNTQIMLVPQGKHKMNQVVQLGQEASCLSRKELRDERSNYII